MSDELDKMFIATLQDLKSDIKQLDTKFDDMHDMLIKNSVVLQEHERRSTASESRLTLLEDKYSSSEKKFNQLKGFFIYTGVLMTAIGTVAAVFHNLILPLLTKKP